MTDHELDSTLAPETLAAQALGTEDPSTGAVVPPIHVATTFARDADSYEPPDGRTYIRDEGPTQEHAERIVCALEGGAGALAFPSGMSACTAAFHALAHGDHVAVSRTIYHGVLEWLAQFAAERGLEVTLYDTGNPDALCAALEPGRTRLVWLETPANPTWAVTDIAAAARVAHAAGAKLAVDSTAATPVHTRPLQLGADLVCHSATKFLNGHSDVLAGMLVTAATDPLWERIRAHRMHAGCVLGPFEAWLLVRGMRTLFLRVPRQSQTALMLARHLAQHDRVEAVHYPGLEADPGHAVASRQMQGGFGAMLSFLVPGGRAEAVRAVSRARLFKRATSLGGVESLIEHRKTSEGPITATPENLIRVSAGIEDPGDLIGDLDWMLSA